MGCSQLKIIEKINSKNKHGFPNSNKSLKDISSKYVIELILSFLPLDRFYKIIKYNKKYQKKLNINFEESIINYQYKILSNEDLISSIKKFQNQYTQNKLNINKTIFLVKYRGFKINNYFLP